MKKTKALLISLLCVEIVSLIVLAVLFALNVITAALFFIFVAAVIIVCGINIFLLQKLVKKIKKQSVKMESKAIVSSGDFMTDIYAILGIPKQYNPDGSLMSIYELLKIHPIYDETGTRMLTPYELLGILPKFDKNINEIPYVFVIKNRIGKIAKVDLTQRVLTRKLTEEEQEQRIIQRTLKEKLAEAEKMGDSQKAAAIKTVIVAQKATSAKKKEIKYTRDTKFSKIKVVDNSKVKIQSLFAKREDKDKPKPSAPKPQPATPSPGPQPQPQAPVSTVTSVTGGWKIGSKPDNNLSGAVKISGSHGKEDSASAEMVK